MKRSFMDRWTLFFLLSGLILRTFHYFRCPSLWHDEAALVLNVLHLDYAALFGSLIHHEAAPPLFLWVEKGIVDLFGDDLFTLRLLPFLASCVALILFWRVSQKLLAESAVPWAVGFFAFSDRMLWHASEAKPYALDILFAVLLIHLWLRTRSWSIEKQCFFWIPFAPIMIWMSYPACFLMGGLLAALLFDLWKCSSIRGWVSYFGLLIIISVSFYLLLIGPAKAQRDGAMEGCWINHFPNWEKPWIVPTWSLFSTLEVIRYNLFPLGQLLVGFVLLGGIWFYQRKEKALLALLLVPMIAVYLAACLHKYPYGGARIIAFLAPAILLLTSASIPSTLTYFANRSHLIRWGAIVLLLVPFGQTVYRTVQPWPRSDCGGASTYVLSQYQPGDGITFNHWEYEYYFRQISYQDFQLEELNRGSYPRLWVVLTGDDLERAKLIDLLKPVWVEVKKKEFQKASVVLMTPLVGREKTYTKGLDNPSGSDNLKPIVQTNSETSNRR